MKYKDQILLEEAFLLTEKIATAKNFVQQGKLSQDDFDAIVNADPTKQKKYVGWLSNQWVNKNVTDIDTLRNTIEEYDSFANRGKVKNKDIYQYKTFSDLKTEIDHLNETGQDISVKDLENDYEVIRDDNNLLIMSPHTHEASRKLGLSHFAYRDCGEGRKDSSWCTTYKAPNHFNDYYYTHNVTFYYIKVKSQNIIKQLKENGFGPEYTVVAIAVLDQNTSQRAAESGYANMDAYDGNDKQFTGKKLKKYLDIIGIN
jgi:archaellum component FlaC